MNNAMLPPPEGMPAWVHLVYAIVLLAVAVYIGIGLFRWGRADKTNEKLREAALAKETLWKGILLGMSGEELKALDDNYQAKVSKLPKKLQPLITEQ